MKNLLLILVALALIGCKKDKPETPLAKPEAKAIFKKDVKGIAIDSTELVENEDSVVVDFYRMNGFETVWNKPEIRQAMIFMLSKAGDEDGLTPNDYAVKKLQLYESDRQLTSEKRVLYDILLTKSVRKYLRHLARGKVNPISVYQTWQLTRNPFDTNRLLSGGISGDSISAIVEMARPPHMMYKKLMTAWRLINDYPEDKDFREIDTLLKIKRRDTSEVLPYIKRRLIYWKDMEPQKDSLSKIFDRKTYAALIKFQKRHGLVPDGVIAKSVIKQLNYTLDQRKGQIQANLERWRWFPHDMGKHYVILNIPGYVLSVVKDGDTLEQKRIVVGKSVRKSPVVSSAFSNIILKPTSTVPPTIIARDLVPDATRNRGYFAAKNITIYRNGKVVNPEDWIPAQAKKYRYVQKPGDDNSLGNVKFNYPSRFMVYLHDTNHKEMFIMHSRSYSSGCIRVENPLPLAAHMLNDSIRWPLDSIKKVVDTKKTTSITVKEKIQIHALYWTAWSDDGQLIFRPDIYDWDARLYNAVRK